MRRKEKGDWKLETPNYSLAEAARYFHIAASTLQYWTGGSHPLIHLATAGPKMLSFKNLAELYVLEGLRREGLSFAAIRSGVEELLRFEESRHPLADFDLRVLHRRELVFCSGERVLNVTLGGQYEVKEWVVPYLRRVDRDPHGRARKIFPFLNRAQIGSTIEAPSSVSIDPQICFGLPTLTGSRITTGFIASRYRGGDSLTAIANSYDRPVAEIKEAIEWETGKPVGKQAA